eukprot:403367604
MPKTTVQKHIKQFQCYFEGCNSSYTRTFRLNFHIRTFHLGVRKLFSCQQCSKNFTEKSNLKIHMRKHTGDRPYSCLYCQQKFSAIGNMKDHQRRHFREKPYQCTCCNKKFYRQYLLVNHAKKLHPKEYKENNSNFIQNDIQAQIHDPSSISRLPFPIYASETLSQHQSQNNYNIGLQQQGSMNQLTYKMQESQPQATQFQQLPIKLLLSQNQPVKTIDSQNDGFQSVDQKNDLQKIFLPQNQNQSRDINSLWSGDQSLQQYNQQTLQINQSVSGNQNLQYYNINYDNNTQFMRGGYQNQINNQTQNFSTKQYQKQPDHFSQVNPCQFIFNQNQNQQVRNQQNPVIQSQNLIYFNPNSQKLQNNYQSEILGCQQPFVCNQNSYPQHHYPSSVLEVPVFPSQPKVCQVIPRHDTNYQLINTPQNPTYNSNVPQTPVYGNQQIQQRNYFPLDQPKFVNESAPKQIQGLLPSMAYFIRQI